MNIKKFLSAILFNLTLSVFVFAAPLPINILVSELEPNVGQDVTVTLKINGNEIDPVYTLSSKINFDSSRLTFKNAQILEEGSLALTEFPYFITDNDEGVIVRTAGFPKGYSKSGSFIKYTFNAKRSGQAYINFQGGQALNADNEDIGVEKKEILLSIQGDDAQPASKTVQTASDTKIDTSVKKKSIAFYISGETAVCQEKDYDFSLVVKDGTDKSVQGRYIVSLYKQTGEVVMSKEVESELVDNLIVLRLPANSLPLGSMLLRVSNANVKQISDKEIGVIKCDDEPIFKQVASSDEDNMTYQILLGIFMLLLAISLIYIIWDHEHFKHIRGGGKRRN